MKIYCLEDFKKEVEKLRKNNSYSSIDSDVIENFFDKSAEEVRSGGKLLNASEEVPYIKKRFNGSGGFRCYVLIIYKYECLYLLFIHPKSGSFGFENISNQAKSGFLKKVIEARKVDDLYRVLKDNNKLIFIPKKEDDETASVLKNKFKGSKFTK